MAPLPASMVAAVFAGAAAFSVALGAIKHAAFKRLDLARRHRSAETLQKGKQSNGNPGPALRLDLGTV